MSESSPHSSRYRTIVADPPWPIRFSSGGRLRRNGRGEWHENNAKELAV
jgi:hypothetical protein